MRIPQKLNKGDLIKPITYRTINEIIDYLHTQKIVGDNKTITVTQGTKGVLLSAIQQGKTISVSNVFPFQLFIINIDGVQKLKIKKGIANISNATSIVFDYELAEKALAIPAANGKYKVFGYVQYVNSAWNHGVFYAKETFKEQNICGFHTFEIGQIEVKTETAVICGQSLFSQIFIEDFQVMKPFAQHYYYSNNIHETVLQKDQPDKLQVNGGILYANGQAFNLSAVNGENKNCCHSYIEYDTQSKTAKLIYENTGSYPGYQVGSKINIIVVQKWKQIIDTDIVFDSYFDYKSISGYDQKSKKFLGLSNGYLNFLQVDGGTAGNINIKSDSISVVENESNYTLSIKDTTGLFNISKGDMTKKLSDGVVISSGDNFEASKGEGIITMNSNKLSFIAENENADDYLGGDFTWKKAGKVKVAQNDILDYLPSKFSSSDTSIAIETINNKIDLKSSGKVKIDESDTTANYLENKLDIADAVSNIFSFETQSSGNKTLKLTSALNGYGVIVVQQGKLKFLQVSDFSKSYALTCNNGLFKWTQISDCEGE